MTPTAPPVPNADHGISPVKSGRGTHILETIRAIRASVGDCLDENELTQLLRGTILAECGFGFVCLSGGFVTLSVPEQDPANWYPKTDWMAPEKETIARSLAGKHQLSLYEPVDTATHFWDSQGSSTPVHHHFEFSNASETVVIAHPHFLKVRLYGKLPDHRYSSDALCPLPFRPDLLQDLSALYS